MFPQELLLWKENIELPCEVNSQRIMIPQEFHFDCEMKT